MPDLKPFDDSSAELLRLVVEAGNIGIWKLDVDTGHAWRNRRHDEIFGYQEQLPEWTYDMFLDHVIEEDRERVDDAQQRAIAQGENWQFECRIDTADGKRRWIGASGRPLLDERGAVKTLIGHVIDITATKQNEERLSMVTQELNHRVRNMLATISAMIKFTARGASDIPTLADTLGGRIEALSRTQELLVDDSHEELDLAEMLDRELGAFAGLDDRVTLHNRENLRLPVHLVQPVALILHELITNAIKYGAFSNDDGRVEIVTDRDDGRATITWREMGGPRVSPPTRTGFGSTLISGALGRSGEVLLHFEPDGLVCEIALPR